MHRSTLTGPILRISYILTSVFSRLYALTNVNLDVLIIQFKFIMELKCTQAIKLKCFKQIKPLILGFYCR